MDSVKMHGMTSFRPYSTEILLVHYLVSPGRFFAAIELKSMLAHVVVTYDVKLEENVTHPPSWHIGTFISANLRAKVMFRNRVD